MMSTTHLDVLRIQSTKVDIFLLGKSPDTFQSETSKYQLLFSFCCGEKLNEKLS
jgi:hypothetical protein